MLSALVPYRDAPIPPQIPGKKPPPPIPTNIAREGFKATNKVCDLVTASIRSHQEITGFVQSLAQQTRRPNRKPQGADPLARDEVGMAIRRWGPTWRSQAMFALLVNVADGPEAAQCEFLVLRTVYALVADVVLAHLSDFASFLIHVRDLGLMDAYTLKPLLDGKRLAKELSTKPGPWMKDALEVVMAWQLRNPDTATIEGAIEEMKNAKMHGELTASLITHFLRLTIRPLFSKNQHSAVTAQGRKVTTNVLPKNLSMDQRDEVTKPWKKDESALDLLRWILNSIDEKAVEQHWPLLLPPLLSITDDTDTRFKTQGCHLISLLLQHTPPSLLTRTGLSEVFEGALLPCLGYLPTLTPANESIALLSEAYPALISLSQTMQDPGRRDSTNEDQTPRRIKLLDTVVRKGVLSAYVNCSENVDIVEVLLRNLGLLVNELGVESTKHIKHVLPMLSTVLSNPFGHAHPSSLLAATNALQSVILNGWPRMAVNKGEVLRGITLCWLHIHGEQSGELEAVRKELRKTVLMLKDAVGPDHGLQIDFRALSDADPRLADLFETGQ